MRSSPTRWPSLPARSALLGAALLLPACVSQGVYRQVADQRDSLATRVADLERSTESLEGERVALLDQIEDMRLLKEELDRDVRALEARSQELEASLAEREKAFAEKAEALEAQRREVEDMRGAYDGLVADLQAEVETRRAEAERLRTGETFTLPAEVLFAAGSAELTAEGRQMVASLAERLKQETERLEVHGHTDSIPVRGGPYPSNWELAGARAASVVRLLAEAGVAPERMAAVSHGANDPVAPNETPEDRARNRRIEIRLKPLPEAAPR